MTTPGRVAAPSWMADVARAVEGRIDGLLAAEEERWAALDPDLGFPLRSLRALVLGGGKRLRPAFCHWAFVGAGGDPLSPVLLDGEAALELLHTFALIHDDVMDGSIRRHGVDAVHVEYERRHREDGGRGESRRYGEGMAILVGDLAFVYADRLLINAAGGSGPGPGKQPTSGMHTDVLEVWTELRTEVNVGQFLDLMGTAAGNPTVASASRICTYKSGKYTIQRPLHLGAALAGGLTAEVGAALTAYGLPLGEAFQLVDDLLGAFGDAGRLGKPVGDDLREGKPTRLLAIALERADAAQAGLLRELVGAGELGDDEIRAVRNVLEATGARAEVEAAVGRMTQAALATAASAPLRSDARKALADLARFVAARDQ